MRFPLLLSLMAFCISSAAVAQAPRVETKLLADHSAVVLGEPFMIGVLFDIEDPWHIYWHYPGDAGMATTITWKLPDGFTVSEIQWPTPKRFTQEGDIEGYGYEGKVMLLAKVTPPADYSGPANLAATVRYLACKDVCVPGRAEVATTLQLGATMPVAANTQTFAEWLREIPLEGKGVTAKRTGMSYELTVAGAPDTAKLEVFVAPPDGALVKSVKQQGGTVTVEFARMAGATITGPAEVVLRSGRQAYSVKLSLE